MRISKIVAGVAVCSFLSACGIEKEITVKRTFHMHAAVTDPLCQTDRLSVDLTQDSAFNDVKSHIKSVELTGVTVTITNPQTNTDSVVTSGNGEVRVSADSTATAVTLSTYSAVPITLGSSQSLTFDATAAKTLTDLALNSPNTFYVEAHGCNNAVPAWYDVEVAMVLKVEGKLF